MYNVMIVEDDPMARRLLEIIVTSDESYHLAVSVESASVAEVYCMTEAIDLILMDVCTALHASGLDAAIKIKKLFPQIRIIIITSLLECSFIERAREGGVDSFWYKDPFPARGILRIDDPIPVPPTPGGILQKLRRKFFRESLQ